MAKQRQPKPRGGAHNVKPPELRRVTISVSLDPRTVQVLQPFASASQRGQVIDLLVLHVLMAGEDTETVRKKSAELLRKKYP